MCSTLNNFLIPQLLPPSGGAEKLVADSLKDQRKKERKKTLSVAYVLHNLKSGSGSEHAACLAQLRRLGILGNHFLGRKPSIAVGVEGGHGCD